MRKLITPKASVPQFEKILRATVLAPLYGVFGLLVLLQTRGGRRITVPGRTNFGCDLVCRLPDLIQSYIWVFNEWEPDLTRFIAGRLRDGQAFVDVGANIGYHSTLAAACVGPCGRVVSVEASPTVFADLQRHITVNQLDGRIRAVNKAAAAEPGTVSIYSGPASNVGMTTTLEQHGGKAEAVVEAVPLADMLKSEDASAIRLIKVDVEGAEPDVVAGMVDLIPRLSADCEIIIELSPGWWSASGPSPAAVLKPFTDAGYHVYEMRNSYSAWRYLWPNDVNDAVRVRRELTERVSRLDLVLSRVDADSLSIDSMALRDRFGKDL